MSVSRSGSVVQKEDFLFRALENCSSSMDGVNTSFAEVKTGLHFQCTLLHGGQGGFGSWSAVYRSKELTHPVFGRCPSSTLNTDPISIVSTRKNCLEQFWMPSAPSVSDRRHSSSPKSTQLWAKKTFLTYDSLV